MSHLRTVFLPDTHASTKASVTIPAVAPKQVFPYLYPPDFRIAPITENLFKLRGISVPKGNQNNNSKFIVLDKVENETVLIGLIGKLWTLSGQLVDFKPGEFKQFNDPEYAKATWEFQLLKKENDTVLTAETCVYCLSKKALQKFRPYWYIVKPFSAFTRIEMLNSIKKSVLNSQK